MDRGSRSQAGQAMVETAIIMPMYVFLVLGLLQLGLMHQARLLTKYAAYKAVRTGALNNANVDAMESQALSTLLPMLSRSVEGDAQSITAVESPVDYGFKYGEHMINFKGIMKQVEVMICGPLSEDMDGKKELDFDDPAVASAGQDSEQAWRDSQRTKLRVQVTFNYTLPIPFADMVVYAMAMGKEVTSALRVTDGSFESQTDRQLRRIRRAAAVSKYVAAGELGFYILPIRASYSMRMQSNVYAGNLPDDNNCVVAWN